MNLPDPGMFHQVTVSEPALDTQEDDMAGREITPDRGYFPQMRVQVPSDT